MAAEREMVEGGARNGGMANGQCSKGWGERCANGRGHRCRCACGGQNHGRTRQALAGIPREADGVIVDEGNRHARFAIVGIETDNLRVTIRDVGPWNRHQSVTNDAEWVVAKMRSFGLGSRRLFYYDSMGSLDELLVRDGRFVGFAPGNRDSYQNCLAAAVEV